MNDAFFVVAQVSETDEFEHYAFLTLCKDAVRLWQGNLYDATLFTSREDAECISETCKNAEILFVDKRIFTVYSNQTQRVFHALIYYPNPS